MTIKEKRTITVGDLHYLCNKRQWYTYGTNEEYENLFARLKENGEYIHLTTEKLQEIAEDILSHSKTEYSLVEIMCSLAYMAASTFYETEA